MATQNKEQKAHETGSEQQGQSQAASSQAHLLNEYGGFAFLENVI